MNKLQKINSQTELEQLIERYFDGETSLQDEQMLREALADCPWESETINEAKFTMGYFAAHKQQRRRATTAPNRFRYTAIAATIAILLAVGVGLLWQNNQPQDVCIAYVNGKAIHNEQEVFNLLQSDLNDMGNATQGLADQLSSLGDAIEIDI